METILITGATGTTGSATLQYLKGKNCKIRVMTHRPEKAAEFAVQGIDVVAADYADPASLSKAVEGADKAFLVHPPSLETSRHEKNFIDAAGKAGVKHIVKISVIGADFHSPLHLARIHAEAEDHLCHSGIGFTILRPHSFMQNLLGNIPTIRGQAAVYSNLGEGSFPILDARDIGAAAAKALIEEGHEGKIYTLTGPANVSFHDIVREIGKAIGKEITYIAVPDIAAKQAMMGAGFPEWLADDLVNLFAAMREHGGGQPHQDMAYILGRPGHRLEDFVRDYADIFAS